MRKTSDIQEIITEITTLHPKIIGVDGEDGQGKSTYLAPQIASSVSGAVIHCDDYLIKKAGSYKLRLSELGHDIAWNTKNKYPLIIEGVMLLKVLSELNIKPSYHVYATSILISEWEEYGEYYNKNLEEIIKHDEELMDKIEKVVNPKRRTKPKVDGFRKEMYEYAYNYRPFEIANYVYVSNH